MFGKIFSGRRAKNIVKRTKKSCIETTFAYPLVIKTGSGCFLEDIDGKVYLDFNSNVCTCNVGYGHPEIIEVLRSFSEVGAHKIAGQDFYCFPEGTLVIGEEVKPIEEIKVGNRVFTHKGRLRKVTKLYKRYYEGPIVKITPHGNNPIFLTPEHPILVKGLTRINSKFTDPTKVRYKIQWRKAVDIVKKRNKNRADMLHLPVLFKNNYKYLDDGEEKIKLTPDVMRFMGYYISEGYVHQDRAIVFCFNKNEEEFISDVKMIAKNEFNVNSSVTIVGNGARVNVFSSKLARLFKRMFRTGATEKRIPEKILLLNDKQLILELIKGYWRGDGTLKSKQNTAMTASKNLAYHLRLLLAKLGIFLSIYYLSPKSVKIEGKDVFSKGGYGLYVPLKFKQSFESLLNVHEIFCDGGEKLPIDHQYNSKKFTKHISMTIDNKHRFNFWVRIRKKEIIENFKGYVYNLKVEEDNSYLVNGFSVHNCEEQVKLAEKVLKIVPRSLTRVLFTNSGAEAVENAIKFAYRKKGPLAGVSFFRAFHGRSIGALSFTDSKAVQKKNYPEVNNELIKFCTDDNDPDINQLEELIKRESEPAFVIVECFQGEGGYRPASKKFIKTLREVTKKHDVPLILDDIQAGMGRTGKWWSFEHYGVEPDIMTAGKSLQVGAVVSTKKYDPNEPGAVSSTWGGGHRIDLAVGLKTIEIIEKEKLLENANKVGNYIMKLFREMQERYPEKIVDVRGLGLMIGVEFKNEKHRDIVVKQAFKDKLLLLGCGFNTLRIAPPLTIKEDDATQGLSIIEKIVRDLK